MKNKANQQAPKTITKKVEIKEDKSQEERKNDKKEKIDKLDQKVSLLERRDKLIYKTIGVDDINEICQKVNSLKDTTEKLKHQIKELKDKVEELKKEKIKLSIKLEKLKTDDPGRTNRGAVDENQKYADAELTKCEKMRRKMEFEKKIIYDVHLAVEELINILNKLSFEDYFTSNKSEKIRNTYLELREAAKEGKDLKTLLMKMTELIVFLGDNKPLFGDKGKQIVGKEELNSDSIYIAQEMDQSESSEYVIDDAFDEDFPQREIKKMESNRPYTTDSIRKRTYINARDKQ